MGPGRYKILYPVLVFVIPMIGICRMSWLGTIKHQLIASQQLEKIVAAGNTILTENAADHDEEFEATDTGIFLADFFYRIHKLPVTFAFLLIVSFQLVVSLTAMAK